MQMWMSIYDKFLYTDNIKWRIEGNTKPFIERNLNIQASITRQNKEYDSYPKHIISDEDDWAYLNLNDLKKKFFLTELSRSMNVAWYRNQSRKLAASLEIPYMPKGKWQYCSCDCHSAWRFVWLQC